MLVCTQNISIKDALILPNCNRWPCTGCCRCPSCTVRPRLPTSTRRKEQTPDKNARRNSNRENSKYLRAIMRKGVGETNTLPSPQPVDIFVWVCAHALAPNYDLILAVIISVRVRAMWYKGKRIMSWAVHVRRESANSGCGVRAPTSRVALGHRGSRWRCCWWSAASPARCPWCRSHPGSPACPHMTRTTPAASLQHLEHQFMRMHTKQACEHKTSMRACKHTSTRKHVRPKHTEVHAKESQAHVHKHASKKSTHHTRMRTRSRTPTCTL